MISALASKACCNSSRFSTSTSTLISGCWLRALSIAFAIPPQAMMWFSLIKNISKRPILWFLPPPQVTAYFRAVLKQGTVFLVSNSLQLVSFIAFTYLDTSVATPDNVCTKFKVVLSAVNMARALPFTWNNCSPGSIASPSFTNQVNSTLLPNCL